MLICFVLIGLSTSLFLVSSNKFGVNPNHLKAHILSDNEIENVQNEDFYRKLTGNQTDNIFILNNDLLVQFISSGWAEDFGYEEYELIKENFFSLIHTKDLPFFANSMLTIMQERKTIENIGPFRIKDKSESYRLYMATAIPLYNKHDEIMEIAIILRDVSIPVGGEENVLESLVPLE